MVRVSDAQIRTAFEVSVKAAIEEIGIDALKRTSLFGSNYRKVVQLKAA